MRGVKLGAVAGALLGVLLVNGCERGNHPQNIGKPAPEFTISDGTHAVDLDKLRGQVVVLNLWASWCAPCVEELPSLLAMQHQLPGVKVVAISMDEDPDVYHKFLEQHHVDMLTVRDPTGRINNLYGTKLIPETYVIDKRGVLRRKFVSAQDWTSPDILRYLRKLEQSS